jgi:hypothetical protein
MKTSGAPDEDEAFTYAVRRRCPPQSRSLPTLTKTERPAAQYVLFSFLVGLLWFIYQHTRLSTAKAMEAQIAPGATTERPTPQPAGRLYISAMEKEREQQLVMFLEFSCGGRSCSRFFGCYVKQHEYQHPDSRALNQLNLKYPIIAGVRLSLSFLSTPSSSKYNLL